MLAAVAAAVVCVGCHSGDDGAPPEEITDATADVPESGPPLFCSYACGPVSSLETPDVGIRPTMQCVAGQICGTASHASPPGFYCCDPDAGLECMPYDLDGACLN